MRFEIFLISSVEEKNAFPSAESGAKVTNFAELQNNRWIFLNVFSFSCRIMLSLPPETTQWGNGRESRWLDERRSPSSFRG